MPASTALHDGRLVAICRYLPRAQRHAPLPGVARDVNDKQGKNTAVSVRGRLRTLAEKRGEDFQLLLTQYGLERLLYRLSQSEYRDRFILKGAVVVYVVG